MTNQRIKYFSALRRQTVWLAFSCGLAVYGQTLAQKVPEAYLQVRYAMGEGKFDSAHVRMDRLFRQPEVYPPLYETAAYIYVYEKRFAAGHAFFDSLLARGHHKGNIAGAHAILWQTQQMPDSSLKYARLAVLENSRCVYPFDIFVEKSFELKNSAIAFELLCQQHQRHPENWRLEFALALYHSTEGKYKAAIDTLRALLAKGIQHWRIYYVLGSLVGSLETWQQARKIHQLGVSFCEEISDDEGRARLLLGRAQAERAQGDWQAATATLQQGVDLTRHIGNQVLEGRLLLLLGELQLQQHQWSKAGRTFALAAQKARQYSEGGMLLHAYFYLCKLAREIGNKSEALYYSHKGYHAADSLGMKNDAMSRLHEIALIELEAGRKDQALQQMNEVLQYALEHKVEWHLSYVYQDLASILTALGRYSEALNYCEQARSLSQKNFNFDQSQRLGFLQGEILLHLGQVRAAQASLLRTANAAKKAKLMTPFMYAQVLLAQIEVDAQQYGRAKQRLSRALSVLPETPAYETNLKALALLANIAWQTGEQAQALKIYDDAARTIMAQTHRLGPQTLTSLSKVERDIFFFVSCAYVETGQVERALAVTERVRDLIVKRKRWQAQQLADAPSDSVRSHQLAVLDSLLQKARLQKAATDSMQLQLDLAAKISDWESQQAALMDSVLGANAASWLDTVPFQSQGFRRGLRDRNELALSFFVGDSSTLIFFLAADTLRAAPVTIGRRGLEQRLRQIHPGLNPTDAGNLPLGAAKLDTAASAGLYRLLLQDFLANRSEATLAIVPDGVLHALPFEILTLPSEVQRYAPFLIERFAVRYGSTLAELRQNEQDDLTVEDFLLAADPALQPLHNSGARVLRNGVQLAPEVGEQEAREICDLVECQTILTGSGLTRDALLSALQRSDWLHFAGHSIWRPDEPLFSEIVLSLLPELNEPEKLFAFEIFQMSLPLKMAILSGCETVRGTFVESEGFEGFVQAFRAAGTPSVIASLWKVDDGATTQFFKAYYEALRAGQSTVRALQSAKIKMLQSSNFNFTDWAAFAYYGRDWRVELPQPWAHKYWKLLVGILVLLLFLGWRIALRGMKAKQQEI